MAVVDLLHGDCRAVMAGLPAASVDAVVCDPPYGLSFMGKDWDHGVPGVAFPMKLSPYGGSHTIASTLAAGIAAITARQSPCRRSTTAT